MSSDTKLIFPDLMYLEDFNNNFSDYFKAVYAVFESHFVKSNPRYLNSNVYAQKKPEVDGLHRTFYHITHEGEDEQNRQPDFRRMERIRFPKFCIENCPHSDLLVWEKRIGRDDRVHIFNETEGYIVVLTKRKDFYLFWTAFFIEQNHQRRKKVKEYEAYIKTKTA